VSALPDTTLSTKDLIVRIANALPADIRSDFYREMMYCRSLPENDEMLRILRIMQFLTLLTVQVPERLIVERAKLKQWMDDTLLALEKTLRSGAAYQAQLDRHLAELPERIAKDISPEAIARTINESLRQQFLQSTIPEIAGALAVSADTMKNAEVRFASTAKTLGEAHKDAAEEVRQASADMMRTYSQAIAEVHQTAAHLSRKYRGQFYALLSIALVLAFLLGARFEAWLDSPAQPVEHAIAPVQPVPSATAPETRPKGRKP
jgi:hypothetical protein